MMHIDTNDQLTDFFTDILGDSIAHIVKHEDPQKFLRWFEQEAVSHFARHDDLFETRQDVRSLAHSLGRAIWNAMPLPGNGFRPRPLPALRRNDPCPCGSGRKFKRCCGGGRPVPALDSNTLWPMLLQKLPASTLEDTIASGKVPIGVLMGVAHEWWEDDRPKKALGLLEPLFKGDFHRTDEEHDYALNLLCNLYDDLGHTRKKKILLARIITEAKRSPLRSGARQRLAAITMDAGDPKHAWELFQTAQRDDPGSASLGPLEVQLLMAEQKPAQARERAKFWVKRLQSQGWPNDEDPLLFLNAIAQDAELAMAKIGIDMSGGAGQRLLDWLDKVAGRPVPEYAVTLDPPELFATADGDWQSGLTQKLAQMGIPAADIPAAIADLEMQKGLETDEALEHEALEHEPLEEDPPQTHFLIPPPAVTALEADWHQVFPLGKPFSTAISSPGDDVWEPLLEDAWTSFLEDRATAFDSLDILDDLAMAVLGHEQFHIPGVDEKLLEPILRRAKAIIDRALAHTDDIQLIWSYADNRPALRCLVQLVYLEQRRGKDAAADLAAEVVALNPDDNHGLRTLVINGLLQRGDDAAALNLADRYPDDMNPDISYGKALALFRLERSKEAQAALQAAIHELPKVPRYLSSKRIRQPKFDPIGIMVGGDDQAWLYRQDMRDVWSATPGAFAWLKQAT